MSSKVHSVGDVIQHKRYVRARNHIKKFSEATEEDYRDNAEFIGDLSFTIRCIGVKIEDIIKETGITITKLHNIISGVHVIPVKDRVILMNKLAELIPEEKTTIQTEGE